MNGFSCAADPSGEAVFSYLLRLFRRYQCCDKRRTGLVSSACAGIKSRGNGRTAPGLAGKACLVAHRTGYAERVKKEKRKFSIFCLTTTRLSRRYTSSRPHRLAGPGQRPFTPSTGVQIPLGTPMTLCPYEKS